ncbi:MAG: hypothetical protein FD131_5167 [Rhodocyclaceae bacterium]|nr:MAG: hypothetical protein FD131_5167 [Rhodocyclaceae bacterium]
MCSPRKTGNTTPHWGRRAPRVGWARKWSWTTGWQRPDGRDWAGLLGEVGLSGTRRRAPRAWKPADERRPAQGSVQRGAPNHGQPLNAATTRMRVTTATPEATRERSNERALAEARCPNSVPSGERPCAPVGHSPAKSAVEQADCGWQWGDIPTRCRYLMGWTGNRTGSPSHTCRDSTAATGHCSLSGFFKADWPKRLLSIHQETSGGIDSPGFYHPVSHTNSLDADPLQYMPIGLQAIPQLGSGRYKGQTDRG